MRKFKVCSNRIKTPHSRGLKTNLLPLLCVCIELKSTMVPLPLSAPTTSFLTGERRQMFESSLCDYVRNESENVGKGKGNNDHVPYYYYSLTFTGFASVTFAQKSTLKRFLFLKLNFFALLLQSRSVLH